METVYETLSQDQPTQAWSPPITRESVRDLSALNWYKSLACVVCEWTLIILFIWGWSQAWAWNRWLAVVLYPLAVFLIGSRQHALAVLMHDAAHFRLLPNRLANDIFAELLLGWPLLISMRAYRTLHFAHHRNPNTDDDPDWVVKRTPDWKFPKTRRQMVWLFLADALGLRLADLYRNIGRYGGGAGSKANSAGSPWWSRCRLGFYILVAALITITGCWPLFLLLWVVPIVTSLKMLLRLRSIAEHFGLEYGSIYQQTRTTYPKWWQRWLISPYNISYHLDHHLYPSVPFYNMPALHAELLHSPDYRAAAHITTDGYAGVLRECTQT